MVFYCGREEEYCKQLNTQINQKNIIMGLFNKMRAEFIENMVPFNESYLSGFKTESYQVDLKEGFDGAKVKMDERIRASVCSDIGGDRQQIHTLNTVYNNITFKHILLPISISAYMFKNKVYRFLINGRTGEVQGERPYSWAKITFAALSATAVVLIIYLLLRDQPPSQLQY